MDGQPQGQLVPVEPRDTLNPLPRVPASSANIYGLEALTAATTVLPWTVPKLIFVQITETCVRKPPKNSPAGHLVKVMFPLRGSTTPAEEMLNKFFGKWEGNETAEELMGIIKQNSSSSEPISFEGV